MADYNFKAKNTNYNTSVFPNIDIAVADGVVAHMEEDPFEYIKTAMTQATKVSVTLGESRILHPLLEIVNFQPLNFWDEKADKKETWISATSIIHGMFSKQAEEDLARRNFKNPLDDGKKPTAPLIGIDAYSAVVNGLYEAHYNLNKSLPDKLKALNREVLRANGNLLMDSTVEKVLKAHEEHELHTHELAFIAGGMVLEAINAQNTLDYWEISGDEERLQQTDDRRRIYRLPSFNRDGENE